MRFLAFGLFLLSACISAPVDDSTPASTQTSTSYAQSSNGPAVEVNGSMRLEAGWWLVDVQAHNVGQSTLGYVQSYCVGTAWIATLSGPAGSNLTYRDPSENQLGCAGTTAGRFEPDAWQNWTADRSCNTYYVCDNKWDGRIWTNSNGDSSQRASPGVYTWTFIFPFFTDAGYVDENGEYHWAKGYNDPEERRRETLVFLVEIGE